MEKKQTILVTGGLGYIGSNMCLTLKSDYNIIVVDNTINASIHAYECLTAEGIECNIFDLIDETKLDNVFRNNHIDIVMHFAALKCVPESILEPIEYYTNNINSLLVLLKIMERHTCTRLIFSSSATVYGSNQENVSEDLTIDGYQNTSPYGFTKIACEQIILNYAKFKPLKCTIFRYFNPIGRIENGIQERFKSSPQSLIENIIYSMKTDCPLTIYGYTEKTDDRTFSRDFIHLKDLIDGHIKALEFNQENNVEIFNLGTGKPCTVKTFIDTFNKITGKNIKYIYGPSRPGDIPVSYCCIDKAKSVLKWTSKYSIEDICKSYI